VLNLQQRKEPVLFFACGRFDLTAHANQHVSCIASSSSSFLFLEILAMNGQSTQELQWARKDERAVEGLLHRPFALVQQPQ
jgi:hypothetical protein